MKNKAFLGQKYFWEEKLLRAGNDVVIRLKGVTTETLQKWQKRCHGMSADSNQCGRRGQWKWLIIADLHKRVQYPISQDTHTYYFLWLSISLLLHSGSYYSFFHNVSTELPSFCWDTKKTEKAERKDRSHTIFSIIITYSGLKRFLDA